MENVTCAVTGQEMNIEDAYRADILRGPLFNLIQKENPQVTRSSFLTPECVNMYREKYVMNLIIAETGDIGSMQRDVVQAIHSNKILAENVEPEMEDTLSLGQRMADKIAVFGGSWTFIICFFTFIMAWILLNVYLLKSAAFDIYPFILLNLILSCLAAIQAPIIMMSQNRQEQKDRIRGEHDYKINLKAELEIKMLHEKMDHLMVHQHMRLLEIQELQNDYLKDILQQLTKNGNKPE